MDANLSNEQLVALNQTKLALDKQLGMQTELRVYPINDRVSYSLSITDEKKANVLTKKLDEMQKNGSVQHYDKSINSGVHGRQNYFEIKPSESFEKTAVNNSPPEVKALANLHEKEGIGSLDADFSRALRNGENPQFLEKLRTDLGIKSDSPIPANATGKVSQKQAYDLIQKIEQESPNGFNDENRKRIDGDIKDVAAHLQKSLSESDDLSDKEIADAQSKTENIIKNARQAIYQRSEAERGL